MSENTINAALRGMGYSKEVHTAHGFRAMARTIMDDNASIEAREAAIEANRLSPDLIPAAVMAAHSLAAAGKAKNAVRILKAAWTAQPHPKPSPKLPPHRDTPPSRSPTTV